MEIRPAAADDYDAYARLFPEGLGVDDPLPSRERFAAEMLPMTLVAVERGDVVGYALFDAMGDVGYVRNLVSAPSHRRTGVGVALMEEMRARLRAAGATQWCLNVKPGNTAAIALYERFGLHTAYRTTVLRLPRSVPLPTPPPDVTLAPLPPEADALAEPKLKLMRGQLAAGRARPSRQVVQLARGAELLGAGVFLATIPGAFPFRVVEPRHAAAMIAHLRSLAPPEATFMQVGVEDDEPLRAEVLRLGASVALELLHLHGPLG